MIMKPVRAVLWDMDGTLIDSEHIAVEALRRAMLENGLPDLPDLYQRVVGRAADAVYRNLVEEFGLRLDAVSWEQLKHNHHFAAGNAIHPFCDALNVFRDFERVGLSQAVVSNSDRAIVDMQLRLAGLGRPGMITVSRNDVRTGKPDPEGYLRAAWLLMVEPDECIVVEDSPSGAAAGLAAGMRTAFVSHATVSAPLGVIQLKTMSDLTRMVLGESHELLGKGAAEPS
jgi:beta-phosphoglucomutase-like phosphatase (HAD superfamily)